MNDGVLVLMGPTAAGKTQLAIALAHEFGAEIVSADSRQVYRDMPVGTAMPTLAQLAAVRHHLVGFLDPSERYSAARFVEDAGQAIQTIRTRGKRAIVVGGTGFYIRALTGAVDLAAEYDSEVRERLAREAHLHEGEFLHGWLRVLDSQRATAIEPGDTYRVLRALEVALVGPLRVRRSAPLATLATQDIPFAKAVLDVPMTEIDVRITARVDAMLAAGLVEEAERIGSGAVAASAVGYPQSLAYLHGWFTRAELRASLVRATRRYARRQCTWFRSEPNTSRVRAPDVARLAREKLGWL